MLARQQSRHSVIMSKSSGSQLTGGDRAATARSSPKGSYSRLSAVVKGPAATITDKGWAPAHSSGLVDEHTGKVVRRASA